MNFSRFLKSRVVRQLALVCTFVIAIGLTWFLSANPEAARRVFAHTLPPERPAKEAVYQGGDELTLFPKSGNATIGRRYRFTLYTHCGIRNSPIDFDRSFWSDISQFSELQNTSPPGFDNPYDKGTIVLLDRETAEYRSRRGISLSLQRIPAPQSYPLCM